MALLWAQLFSLTYIVRCVVSCLAAPPKGFAFGWLHQAAGALIIILGPKQWKLKFEPKELAMSPSAQQQQSTDHSTAQGNNYTAYSVPRKWTVTIHPARRLATIPNTPSLGQHTTPGQLFETPKLHTLSMQGSYFHSLLRWRETQSSEYHPWAVRWWRWLQAVYGCLLCCHWLHI